MSDIKEFDEIVSDISNTKTALATATELITYIPFDQKLVDELDLICSTLKEALQRLHVLGPKLKEMPELKLSIRQIRIMANDLVETCKNKITITS